MIINCFAKLTSIPTMALPGIVITALVSIIAVSQSTSALTYQDSTDVKFTFSPTININLSSTDLVIPELTSGSSSDSNEVTVSVSTNTGYGYYLSATAGTKTGNTSLNNTLDSSYKFTNLTANAPSLSAMPDNSWGYSYSTDNGTTWVSGDAGSTMTGYNGLPLDNDDSGATGIKLVSTDSFTSSSSIKFKIGAKSAPTQAAGTYTNTVNFYAVANPGPQTIADATYLQDVEACPASLAAEQIYTVKDARDNQEYKVAKLKDGKCWMVENLNLAGGTALDAEKTDVTNEYIANYSAGDSRLEKTDGKLVLPASSTSGFNNSNYSFVYNSGNKTDCGASEQNIPCYSYYSWDAATLGSGRSISTDNADAPYSICPKGWKLPTSRSTEVTNWQTTSDFYQLVHQYGLDSTTSTSESDDGFYTQAGPGTTLNFLLAGSYYTMNRLIGGGSSGSYWSSTSYSNTARARYLYFNSSTVNSAGYNTRYMGYSVRCLFSGQ